MSRVCELSGAKPKSGHNVSHSKRRTKTTWKPNLQEKRYFIPSLNNSMKITLSTSAIKNIEKSGGIEALIQKTDLEKLSPRLQKIKRKISKAAQLASQTKAAA